MKKHKTMNIFLASLISLSAWAGEFDDHCTTGLSLGKLIKTTCEINTVFEGKVYCFGNAQALVAFEQDPKSIINKAVSFYAKNAEPEREKISLADALKQIDSKNCNLSNKDAGYLALDNKDLRHCNMVNTSFFGAYLRGTNLRGANLQGAYLNLARLENADFSGANLQDATIFQAIFDKTNFKGANLSNARMIGTLVGLDMSEAIVIKGRYGLDIGNQPMGAMRFEAIGGKFANTNFEGSDINRANLRFADLTNANLRGADLFRADFSKANLTGADITGANFNEAILDDTMMTGVKGLEAIKGYAMEKGQCIDCDIVNKGDSAKSVALTALDEPATKNVPTCPLARHTLEDNTSQHSMVQNNTIQ